MRWIEWLIKEEGPLPKNLNSVGAALPAYRQAGAAARFTSIYAKNKDSLCDPADPLSDGITHNIFRYLYYVLFLAESMIIEASLPNLTFVFFHPY
jgi:hypothetical protein